MLQEETVKDIAIMAEGVKKEREEKKARRLGCLELGSHCSAGSVSSPGLFALEMVRLDVKAAPSLASN